MSRRSVPSSSDRAASRSLSTFSFAQWLSFQAVPLAKAVGNIWSSVGRPLRALAQKEFFSQTLSQLPWERTRSTFTVIPAAAAFSLFSTAASTAPAKAAPDGQGGLRGAESLGSGSAGKPPSGFRWPRVRASGASGGGGNR